MARWSAWKKEAPIAGNLSTLKRLSKRRKKAQQISDRVFIRHEPFLAGRLRDRGESRSHLATLKSSRMDSTSRRVDSVAHSYARG